MHLSSLSSILCFQNQDICSFNNLETPEKLYGLDSVLKILMKTQMATYFNDQTLAIENQNIDKI